MLRQLMNGVAVVVMVALAVSAVPVQAQGDVPAPAACTPDEQQALAKWVQNFGEQYGAAMEIVADPTTAADFTTVALALNDVLRAANEDDSLAYCTDVLVVTPAAEVMLYHHILTMQLGAAYIYASDAYAEAELLDGLMSYFDFHQAKTLEYQDEFAQLAEPAVAATPILAEWLPACTDADYANTTYTQLVDLESALDEQSDAVSAFLSDGAVDFATLFALEDTLVAWETLTEDMPPCHEVYMREAMLGSIHFELAAGMYWSALEGAEAQFTDAIVAAREAIAADVIEDVTFFAELYGAAQ